MERVARVTVVLADDHPVVLSGLEALLRGAPRFSIVATVADGVAAFQAVQKLHPDIAVLDVNMPGLTGMDVLATIQREKLPTKTVFLTGSANDANIVAAYTGGASGLLLKQAAAETLVQCLERVAAGERFFPRELVEDAQRRELERTEDAAKMESILTPREREIAILVGGGLSNKHIARRIQISEGTVKIHLHNAYQKLGVANRTALATLANRYWAQDSGLKG